jgi:hypothetical protein
MAKTNHNEALRVRSALKAGIVRLPAGNHNEALRVRSALKAGLLKFPGGNHNEGAAGPVRAQGRRPHEQSQRGAER